MNDAIFRVNNNSALPLKLNWFGFVAVDSFNLHLKTEIECFACFANRCWPFAMFRIISFAFTSWLVQLHLSWKWLQNWTLFPIITEMRSATNCQIFGVIMLRFLYNNIQCKKKRKKRVNSSASQMEYFYVFSIIFYFYFRAKTMIFF